MWKTGQGVGGQRETMPEEDALRSSKRYLARGDAPDASEGVFFQEIAEYVRAALREIPYKEARVLSLRFGLSTPDGEPMPRKDVGELMGVGKDRIRQIEIKALKRLEPRMRHCKHAFIEQAPRSGYD